MRLFLYGTLLDGSTLNRRSGTPGLHRRCRPAVLGMWRRVALRGMRYPTLRRARAGIVAGTVVDSGAFALARLRAYEGPLYRMVRVTVRERARSRTAWAFIAAGVTPRAWTARRRFARRTPPCDPFTKTAREAVHAPRGSK